VTTPAADFLEDLRKAAPAGVWSVITSDHQAFGHPAGEPWDPKFPDRIHPFIKACRASHIGRTVEKSNNSARMATPAYCTALIDRLMADLAGQTKLREFALTSPRAAPLIVAGADKQRSLCCAAALIITIPLKSN
jgi:hypothetical protein